MDVSTRVVPAVRAGPIPEGPTASGGLAPRPGDGPDDGRPFLVRLQRRAPLRGLRPGLGARERAAGGPVLHPLDHPPLRADLPLPLGLLALHLGPAAQARRGDRGGHHPVHLRPGTAHRRARPALDGLRPPRRAGSPGPVRDWGEHDGPGLPAPASGPGLRSAGTAPGRPARGARRCSRPGRRDRQGAGGARPRPGAGGAIPRVVPVRALAGGDAARLGRGRHGPPAAGVLPGAAGARQRRRPPGVRRRPGPERVWQRRPLPRRRHAHPVAPHRQVPGEPQLPRLRARHRLAVARGAVDLRAPRGGSGRR